MSDWLITESGCSPRLESVFALGNGYLGLRGEGTHDPGAVLNGFHETWPIVYPEDAPGNVVRTSELARTGGRNRLSSGQTTVPAPDGTIVRLFADGEPLDASGMTRTLDMRRGLLLGGIEWTTSRGVRLLVRTRRLVSLQRRHLAALEYEVVALDGPVRVELSSELVPHEPLAASDDPRASRGVASLERVDERVGAPRTISAPAWTARSTARPRPDTRRSSVSTCGGWPSSGTAATSSSTARTGSSAPCASTCSSCCRRARAPRGSACPPRASPAAATRATTSGTPRSTSSRSWLALVAGFAGLRDFEGEPRFDPRLPAEWDRLRFRLAVRGRVLEVELTHAGTLYSVLGGHDLAVVHRGTRVPLRAGTSRFVADELAVAA